MSDHERDNRKRRMANEEGISTKNGWVGGMKEVYKYSTIGI